MAELWNEFWYVIVLFVLIVLGGGISWSRYGRGKRKASGAGEDGAVILFASASGGGRSAKDQPDAFDTSDAGCDGGGGD
ncbi:MAG: hypothetical protein ACFE0P_14790 [Oceanicaulis sp.]